MRWMGDGGLDIRDWGSGTGRERRATIQYPIPNCRSLSLSILAALLLLTSTGITRAQEIAPQTLYVVGATLLPTPGHQTVPKNTATGVLMQIVSSEATVGALPSLPADAIVRARLRGPAFQTAVELSGKPGEALMIPPIPLKGLYVVEDIRIESDGLALLTGNPASVSLEVIDRVLVSQVTTRALSATEIQEKGIYFDEQNYKAVDFTVAIGVKGEKVPVSFPVLVARSPELPARRPQILPSVGGLVGQRPETFAIFPPQIPLTNLGISGFTLECEGASCNPEVARLMPVIPGVIVFPGRIAYLNQFFSALLLVSNVSPNGSNLVVRDLQAEIVLPTGKDSVLGSRDDPLRMARLGIPPAEQSRLQPVRQVGPDSELGTADDLAYLDPGHDGNAEFLVEGLAEGIHTVEIEIAGQLHGLPTGPVTVKGRAVGTLEVRDPQFTLTFNHPVTVNQGEEYDFHVTVTNISETPANFATLSLLPRSISGAQLLSAETVNIDTIPPGDSATATFRLRSLQTGSVVASSLASIDTPGKFEFRMDVGELGIPLSPSMLELPREVQYLPDDLRTAAIALLGQGYALATSPITPPGLQPVSRTMIFQRAIDLATSGQRIFLSEPLRSVAWDLALDFGGNHLSRLTADDPIRTEDVAAFDRLYRQSRRGTALTEPLAAIFAASVQAQSALAFQADMAAATRSREAHLSVITGDGAGGAPVILRVTDPDGKHLGCTLPQPGNGCTPIVRGAPFGQFFPLLDSTPLHSNFALIAAPKLGDHIIELVGTADGIFDLGVVLPTAGGLSHLTYAQIAIERGGRARLVVTVAGVGRTRDAAETTLAVDADGDGLYEGQITPTVSAVDERGPQPISAVQMAALDGFGRVVALLFDEEIDGHMATCTVPLAECESELAAFEVEANKIQGVRIQPSQRVVIMSLSDGIGPLPTEQYPNFITRTLALQNVRDRHGNAMSPISTTLTITPTVTGPGGVVDGVVQQADGRPIPGAPVVLRQKTRVGEQLKWTTISAKNADSHGRFHFDYVVTLPTTVHGSDPESNRSATLATGIRYHGQRLDLDITLRGTGTLVGRALAADGVTPLPGARIGVDSLVDTDQRFVATTDANGAFAISGIPVGNANVIAVHQATRAQTRAVITIAANGSVAARDFVLIPLTQITRQTGPRFWAGLPQRWPDASRGSARLHQRRRHHPHRRQRLLQHRSTAARPCYRGIV